MGSGGGGKRSFRGVPGGGGCPGAQAGCVGARAAAAGAAHDAGGGDTAGGARAGIWPPHTGAAAAAPAAGGDATGEEEVVQRDQAQHPERGGAVRTPLRGGAVCHNAGRLEQIL